MHTIGCRKLQGLLLDDLQIGCHKKSDKDFPFKGNIDCLTAARDTS